MKSIKAAYIPIVFGIFLLMIAFFTNVPGGALITKEDSNGLNTTYYVFDNKFSAIDEYVGGDAYNFIIGASLVAGKMSGAMVSKSIYITGGLLSICAGLTMLKMQNDEKEKIAAESKKDQLPEL